MKTKPAVRAKRAATPRVAAQSLPGPETITRQVLPNGITVLAYENFTSPSVVVDSDLRTGALWESRAQAGLAGFTAAALMRGTERSSFDEIYDAIESAGAALSVSAGTHTSGFYGKSLAEDLPLILELAADALRRPTFPEEQVERLRNELLTRLAIRDNNTRARAEEAFFTAAYPGHPYAIDEDGYPDTLKALTRADLVNFHQAHFGPRGMIVTVVGAVKAEAAVELVERWFGNWANPAQPPEPPLPPVAQPQGKQLQRVVMPGKSQSDLVLGGPGPARNHPRFLAARLANNILGVFGMGGRIGEHVREKGGLAYYAASSLDGGLGPGPWRAYAGVNPKNVARATELIVKEIAKFVNRKVTVEELDDNKANFLGRLPFTLETNEGLAGNVSAMELHNLGLDYLRRYPNRIKAITRDDLQAVAAEFLSPENYVLAVAGPE
ncbi:MAG: insulinase family protein [Anaerolineales bacterium]|nr:insulinase family protein [Anaerolineales bacterium]